MEKFKRAHLVNLFKWRSITAFLACLVTFVFSFGSILYALTHDPIELVRSEYEWFTVDSNCLTALAALMIMPYAIEGITRKRFIYPKWMMLLHYSGTICTTVTLMFVLAFISWYDPILAFGYQNFFLHIICPLTVLISFFMVESDYTLTKKDTLLGMIPFTAYAVAYLYNVVIAGNWQDHYMLNTFTPFYFSLPGMFVVTYLISMIIRYVHNRLAWYRKKKMKIIWDKDLDVTSIKIEIYSLGFHAGLHQDEQDISIPLDILEDVSQTFNIRIEELVRAFSKGVIDGNREINRRLSSII